MATQGWPFLVFLAGMILSPAHIGGFSPEGVARFGANRSRFE
jgi:hypothetical protein